VKGLQPDRSEVLRALDLLAKPGQVVELRLLEVQSQGNRIPVTMSGYFDDFELLANSACRYGGSAKGVYVTLNPVKPALLARAANRLRIAGKNAPLTSEADITARAFEIRDALRQQDWPNPIVGDSGNGAHLLYRVEIPTSDNELVKQCLQALARRFDNDRVKVDQRVFNPARIWKLYGTVSRKGDNVADRPHRLARILEAV
jgi:hypothetical protein